MTELEKLVKVLRAIELEFEHKIVTADMKIYFNLPVEDRYKADQVIILPESVFFFDHKGEFLGIGLNGNSDEDGNCQYIKNNNNGV